MRHNPRQIKPNGLKIGVEDILLKFTREYIKGKRPSIDEYVNKYPEYMDKLPSLLETVAWLYDIAATKYIPILEGGDIIKTSIGNGNQAGTKAYVRRQISNQSKTKISNLNKEETWRRRVKLSSTMQSGIKAARYSFPAKRRTQSTKVYTL
jgi:hypothetical protein